MFHDDQHGTAVVVAAALTNALRVVDKKLPDVRIVVSGVGAAGSAIVRLLLAQGARDIIACDRAGILRRTNDGPDDGCDDGCEDVRAWIAHHTNDQAVEGSLKDALVGADVFIGVSAPRLLDGADIATMAPDAIVFALANPDPEVDPHAAMEYAAVVATGRSDYPNQINNVLAFPGIFRGLLDAAAVDITDDMLLAAAVAIADIVQPGQLNADYIVPSVFDPAVAPAVAEAIRTHAR